MDYYTEDLAQFGSRERAIAAELLACRLPEGFNDDGVKLGFNKNSGFVFLVNADYQCAMMNGDKLEIFHSTPHDGNEGFLTDLIDENEPGDLHREDAEYIIQCAENEGIELTGEWKVWAGNV